MLGHLAEARLDLGEYGAARAAWLTAAGLLDGLGSPETDEMRTRADAVSAPTPDDAVDGPREPRTVILEKGEPGTRTTH